MRIGLDYNGVVADSMATKIDVASRFLKVDIPEANVARRTLNGVIDEAEYDILQQLVYWTSEALKTPAVKGVIPQVMGQLALGNEVFCVSRLAPEGVQFGRQWLAEHGLGRDMLVSVGRGGEKSWVLRAGFDVYVDDRASILNSLKGVVRQRLLLSTPYNQEDELDDGVVRVDYASDLTEHLSLV